MLVTIYVNWYEEKVMTEKQYREEIERRAKKATEDEEQFADWLEQNYSTIDLHNMEGQKKMAVRKAFLESAIDDEETVGFGSSCEEFTFEI